MKSAFFAYSNIILHRLSARFAVLHNHLNRFLPKTLFIFLFCTTILCGCERPMDNPESVDRIFNDLNQEAKTQQAAAAVEKKALEDIEKDIASTKMGDNSIKTKFRKKYESEHKIEALEQKAEYYSLRALKRKEYVTAMYPKYFEKKAPWPDQDEWANYQASKRLASASRDWNNRVPQLGKRIKDYNAKASAEFSGAPTKEGAKKEAQPKPESKKKASEAESEAK